METPQYVWEVWRDRLFRQPLVKRYRLVKLNPKGGATVLVRGSTRVIRPMMGKTFHTDEAAVQALLATWTDDEIARARDRLADLTADRDKPFCGIEVEEVRSEPYPSIKNLKT